MHSNRVDPNNVVNLKIFELIYDWRILMRFDAFIFKNAPGAVRRWCFPVLTRFSPLTFKTHHRFPFRKQPKILNKRDKLVLYEWTFLLTSIYIEDYSLM